MSKQTSLNKSYLSLVLTKQCRKDDEVVCKVLTETGQRIPTNTEVKTITKTKNIPLLLQQATCRKRNMDVEETYDFDAIKTALNDEISKQIKNLNNEVGNSFFMSFFTRVDYYRLLTGHFHDLFSNLPDWRSTYNKEFPQRINNLLNDRSNLDFNDYRRICMEDTIKKISEELYIYFKEKIDVFFNQIITNIVNDLITTRSIDSAMVLRQYNGNSGVKLYLLNWLKTFDNDLQIEQALDAFKAGKLSQGFEKFGRPVVVDELVRILIRIAFSRKPNTEQLKLLLGTIIHIYVRDRLDDTRDEIGWLLQSKIWFFGLFQFDVNDEYIFAVYDLKDDAYLPYDDAKWIIANNNFNLWNTDFARDDISLGLSKCLENITFNLKMKSLIK